MAGGIRSLIIAIATHSGRLTGLPRTLANPLRIADVGSLIFRSSATRIGSYLNLSVGEQAADDKLVQNRLDSRGEIMEKGKYPTSGANNRCTRSGVTALGGLSPRKNPW